MKKIFLIGLPLFVCLFAIYGAVIVYCNNKASDYYDRALNAENRRFKYETLSIGNPCCKTYISNYKNERDSLEVIAKKWEKLAEKIDIFQ